ncbi:MAG: PIN domain nuclease [Thermoleophilia bacterium]
MVVLLRVILAVLGGIAGYQLAEIGLDLTSFSGVTYILLVILAVLVSGLIGSVLGGLLGRQVLRMSSGLDRAAAKISGAALLVTGIGLLFGLGVGALGSLAVKDLPVVGVFLPPVIFALTAYVFAYLAYRRHGEIGRMLGFKSLGERSEEQVGLAKILDTSVIIDARIGDIVPTHFVDGDLVIPEFVLEELQSIADSADPLKRARGRRGLECVRSLQSGYERVIITDRDFPGLNEVDAKLIKLAKELKAKIITTDYNLNKLAQIQGVEVLNVNQLANALKPVVLPGESLEVHVIREGKEEDQGVAYLDDGTMVVIEGGRRKVGQDVEVHVTSVLQNPSGKMVFTKLAS